MADDSKISVEIVAKIDELGSGLNAAVTEIRSAIEQINDSLNNFRKQSQSAHKDTQEHFQTTSEKVRSFAENLSFALRGGEFLIFEEIAKQALEIVERAFDQTIGKVLEFQEELNNMSKIMGEPSDKLGALDLALRAVGVSAEAYAQTSLRMQQRLRQNKELFELFIPALKGQNIEQMSSNEIMKAAIDRFNQLSDGTQKAQFALQIFGRNVQDVYKISEATGPVIDQMSESLAAFGIDTSPKATKAAQDFIIQMRELKIEVDLMWMSVGEHLLPVFQDFINYLSGDAGTTLQKVALSIEAIADYIMGLTVAVVGFFRAWYDAATLNFSQAKKDLDEQHNELMKLDKDLQSISDKWDELNNKFLQPVKITPIQKPEGLATGTTPDLQELQRALSVDDARIKDALKLKQLQLAGEKELNDYRLSSGQETIDAWITASKNGIAEVRAAQLSAVDQEIALQRRAQALGDQNAPAKIKALADQRKIIEEQTQQQLNLIDQKGTDYRITMQQQATQDQIQNDQAALADKIQGYENDYDAGKISLKQKVALERDLTTATLQEAIRQTQIWIDFYNGDVTQQRKYIQQKIQLEQQLATRLRGFTNQETQYEANKWKTAFSTITSAFTNSLSGMLKGTMTWKEALGNILDSILDAFLGMLEKMLEEWALNWLMQQIIGETTSKVTASGTIADNAAVAASGAYAATAAIPYIGPALAPAAAATAYAGTLAWESALAFEKGGIVPSDQMALVHKNEMVLPAAISERIQDMAKSFAGGGGGGGGGSAPFVFSPNVSAMDGKSVVKTLKDRRTLRSMAHAYQRYLNLNPSTRGNF